MKKGVLYLLIATFSIGALLGIGIIILDLWNDLTSKVLLTTLTIFGFSVPALCCASLYDKTNERVFPIVGITTCVLAAFYSLLLVWEVIIIDLWDDHTLKCFFEGILLSISFGHISLLFLINSNDQAVLRTRNGTIIVSIALDILLTLLIFISDFDQVVDWQVYAVLAILIVLGTIVTPILNKARKSENKVTIDDNKNDAITKLDDLLKNNYVTEDEYKKILNRINNRKG